jgi:hypothetical protein
MPKTTLRSEGCPCPPWQNAPEDDEHSWLPEQILCLAIGPQRLTCDSYRLSLLLYFWAPSVPIGMVATLKPPTRPCRVALASDCPWGALNRRRPNEKGGGGRPVDGDCEWGETSWQTEARAHQSIFASKSRVCLTCLLSLFCSHEQCIYYFRPRADLQSPSETCHVLLQESPKPVNSMPMRNCGGTRGNMLPAILGVPSRNRYLLLCNCCA